LLSLRLLADEGMKGTIWMKKEMKEGSGMKTGEILWGRRQRGGGRRRGLEGYRQPSTGVEEGDSRVHPKSVVGGMN